MYIWKQIEVLITAFSSDPPNGGVIHMIPLVLYPLSSSLNAATYPCRGLERAGQLQVIEGGP